jgi:hypothetical protein
MEGSLVAYKVFTNGSVLNASEINDNLMNQSVMVFSNATARSAALTAPVEGMLTWLEDLNKYQNYDGSAWVDLGGGGAILQVVSTTKRDTFSTSSTSYTDVTGLSASITPSSATSKVLVMADVKGNGTPAQGQIYVRISRGGTAILIADAAGSRDRGGASGLVGDTAYLNSHVISGLDSPASTSALTYAVQVRANASSVFVNRGSNDQDAAATTRTVSSITLMEVAG